MSAPDRQARQRVGTRVCHPHGKRLPALRQEPGLYREEWLRTASSDGVRIEISFRGFPELLVTQGLLRPAAGPGSSATPRPVLGVDPGDWAAGGDRLDRPLSEPGVLDHDRVAHRGKRGLSPPANDHLWGSRADAFAWKAACTMPKAAGHTGRQRRRTSWRRSVRWRSHRRRQGLAPALRRWAVGGRSRTCTRWGAHECIHSWFVPRMPAGRTGTLILNLYQWPTPVKGGQADPLQHTRDTEGWAGS